MAARVKARQDHLQFLAGAVAKFGDCSSNMPVYLSPTALGHLNRWAVLPWCSAPSPPAAGSEHQASGAKQRAGDDEPARTSTSSSGPAVLVRRPLVAFASSAEEQAALRSAVMNGCC